MNKSVAHWYARYVGDYRKKTATLSLAEHGAYALLLDEYFINGPLDANASRLHRICMAFEADEQASVQAVLEKFFVLRDGKYHNPRADEELLKREEIKEKRASAARSRWDANAYANAPTSTSTSTVKDNPPNPLKGESAVASRKREPKKKGRGNRYPDAFNSLVSAYVRRPDDSDLAKAFAEWDKFAEEQQAVMQAKAERDRSMIAAGKLTTEYRFKLYKWIRDRKWEAGVRYEDSHDVSLRGRTEQHEHHNPTPAPNGADTSRDDHLGGLFPDSDPVHRADGAGGHAGRGDPVAAGADGGLAEVHHLDRWRRERQMPPDYRGADVPRRAAVAGELSDAMAGSVHGQPPRQSRFH